MNVQKARSSAVSPGRQPGVLAERLDGEHDRLVERLRLDLDPVADAARVLKRHRAGAKRHVMQGSPRGEEKANTAGALAGGYYRWSYLKTRSCRKPSPTSSDSKPSPPHSISSSTLRCATNSQRLRSRMSRKPPCRCSDRMSMVSSTTRAPRCCGSRATRRG